MWCRFATCAVRADALAKMRRFGLATSALLVGVLVPAAQLSEPSADIGRMIRDVSRALQAGNAPLFLAAFDRNAIDDFDALREQVTALVAQRRIASSVAVGTVEGGPDTWTVRVDWLLELTPRLDPGPLRQRRETLTLGVRKRGGRWKIVSGGPSKFFAAMLPSTP